MTELVSGLISVIVPIYNVEPFLRDCLDSLRAQTYPHLQVILVDDGSTDGCAAIAAEYVAADPRFQLISQANAGLSAARNNGLPAAEGEFLAFVDSDDVLAAHAYEMLLRALDGGADFASGGVLRLNARGPYQGTLHRDAIKGTDLAAHVSRDHALLRDRTVWNKLYRREFYDRHGFEFPVGRLYEDVPVTLPAHALAEKVAVVAEPIYFWRAREGAVRSITQSGHDLRNLVDRFYTVNLTRRLLDHAGHDRLRRVYEAQAVWDKLSTYLKYLPGADREFRDTFMDLAGAYLEQVGPKVVDQQPEPVRSQWKLVLERRLDELIELVDADFRPASRSAEPRALVHSVAWRDDELVLTGTVTGRQRFGALRMFWLRGLGDRRMLPLWGKPDPAGFRLSVDPARLKDGGAWREATWALAGAVVQGRNLHRISLRISQDRAVELPGRALSDGYRIVPVVAGDHLRLRISRTAGELTGSRREGDDLLLEGRLWEQPAAAPRIELTWARGVVAHSVPAEITGAPGAPAFTARIPLAGLAGTVADDNHASGRYAQRLTVNLVIGGDSAHLYAGAGYQATRTTYGADEVYVAVSDARNVLVCTRPPGPVVTSAEAGPDGVLVLRGDSPRPVRGELVLQLRGRRKDLAVPLDATAGAWELRLDPSAVPTVLAGELPLVSGTWDMAFRSPGERRATLAPLGFAAESWDALPALGATADGARFALNRAPNERAALVVEWPSHGDVRQPPPAALAKTPLRDEVLFDAAPGRRLHDDPAALLAELRGRPGAPPVRWTAEHGDATPEGVERVLLGSDEWRCALATSRWIVTNDDLPRWFRPRRGQVVLRLGGGWPVARFGALAAAHPFGRSLIEQLTADAGKWTAVASPGPEATGILRRELLFEGRVLEYGRPAADLLTTGDAEEARAALAASLGLAADTRFVLYAPTRRLMDLRKRGWSDPGRLLNLQEVVAALPPGHQLLVRRHPGLFDDVLGLAEGVLDVSGRPRVDDLLLAVDALISDYSSVIADFAVTDRPILLYVPDLADFKQSPGLNADLERKAPGPVLRTSTEVAAALRDLGGVTAEYEAAAKAFAASHSVGGDGRAAAKLVDWLLAAGR